jgi:hypothetical protein
MSPRAGAGSGGRRWSSCSSGCRFSFGLPILVRALSFVDHQTQQGQYVVCWLLVLFCLALILLSAAIDVLDTLRISRQERRRNFLDAHAAAALAREAGKKEEGAET